MSAYYVMRRTRYVPATWPRPRPAAGRRSLRAGPRASSSRSAANSARHDSSATTLNIGFGSRCTNVVIKTAATVAGAGWVRTIDGQVAPDGA